MDWNLIVENIGAWFAEHGTVFSISTIFAGGLGWTIWYLVKKVVPALTQKILMFVATIIGKMFGVDASYLVNGVNELPIVADLKRQHAEYLANKEDELIKLKTRLVSGKLTEAERIAQEYLFDKITKDLGENISEKTLEVLNKLERYK